MGGTVLNAKSPVKGEEKGTGQKMWIGHISGCLSMVLVEDKRKGTNEMEIKKGGWKATFWCQVYVLKILKIGGGVNLQQLIWILHAEYANTVGIVIYFRHFIHFIVKQPHHLRGHAAALFTAALGRGYCEWKVLKGPGTARSTT